MITALADFVLKNASGQDIDNDHPDTTLTTAEQAAFLSWLLGELATYEAATGLERWTAP